MTEYIQTQPPDGTPEDIKNYPFRGCPHFPYYICHYAVWDRECETCGHSKYKCGECDSPNAYKEGGLIYCRDCKKWSMIVRREQ